MNNVEREALMCFSDVFSGKWKLLILYELMNGELRFKELKSALSGISAKVLTQTIQEMVNEGIILRIAYPEVPPRVSYSLSKRGRSMVPLVKEMLSWGKAHQKYRNQWQVYRKTGQG